MQQVGKAASYRAIAIHNSQFAMSRNGQRQSEIRNPQSEIRYPIFAASIPFMYDTLQTAVAAAFADRSLIHENTYADAVRAVIEEVDKGRLRVAQPSPDGEGWVVNEWVKQAILLYFGIQPMQTWDLAPFEFY